MYTCVYSFLPFLVCVYNIVMLCTNKRISSHQKTRVFQICCKPAYINHSLQAWNFDKVASLDEKGTVMVLMIIMCAALNDFILDMSEVVFFQ